MIPYRRARQFAEPAANLVAIPEIRLLIHSFCVAGTVSATQAR
jgi:hypothetical protein